MDNNEQLLDADITREGNIELATADVGLRFLNFLLDSIAIFAISLGVALVTESESELLGYLVYLVYFIAFEGSTGRTLGKYITGTIVVKDDGGKPEITDVVIRSISRIVPFEPFSFFGKSGRGWHDRWSKTYVIKASEAPMV